MLDDIFLEPVESLERVLGIQHGVVLDQFELLHFVLAGGVILLHQKFYYIQELALYKLVLILDTRALNHLDQRIQSLLNNLEIA